MKSILFAMCALLLALGSAGAGPGVQGDACQNPMGAKQSVAVNISSATTTELVAAVANTTSQSGLAVDVCGIALSLAGTSPTVQFEYGTKASTACDTGATALTGTFAASAGSLLNIGGSFTHFAAPTGKELCIVTTGSGSPSFQGVVTYALQ